MPTAAATAFALRHRGLLKAAADDSSGDDANFEAAFANVAHAFVADRAPGLLDYLVGFQVIERDDDANKAVGIFGFKVGSQWLYAPVFWVDGDLKADPLYIKQQKQFVPMDEGWVNYLTSKKPAVLGESAPRDGRQLGVRHADVGRALRGPYQAKYGSAVAWGPGERAALDAEAAAVSARAPDDAALRRLPPWAKVAAAALAGVVARPSARCLSLLPLLRDGGVKVAAALHRHLTLYPRLRAALDATYDAAAFADAVKAATYPGCGMRRKRRRRGEKRSVLEQLDADVRAKVAVYRGAGVGGPPVTFLDEADREALFRDGVLIKDAREDGEVSRAYKGDVREGVRNQFQTPDRSGLYDVLLKDGSVEKCLVAVGPAGPAHKMPWATAVRLDGRRRAFLNVDTTRIWARPGPLPWDGWYEDLPEAKTVEQGKYHMLVGPRGECTAPFRVLDDRGETAGGGKCYDVHFDLYARLDRETLSKLRGHDPYDGGTDGYVEWRDGSRIHLGQRTGTKFRIDKGDVYVPDGFRLLKLEPDEDAPEDPQEEKTPRPEGGAGQVDPMSKAVDKPKGGETTIGKLSGGSAGGATDFLLGDAMDVELEVLAKTARLGVTHQGTSVLIDGAGWQRRLHGKEAVVHLVRDHGLREDSAVALLDDAAGRARRREAAEYRVKYAAGYPDPYLLQGGPHAPPVGGDDPPEDEFMGGAAPGYGGYEEYMPVDDVRPDPDAADLYESPEPDPMAMQVAHRAAETGQKDVFDASIVGSILKGTRDDQLVDKYIGPQMKALSGIGELLCKFWYHRDKFEDRYGRDDAPELEDSLRNNFHGLGELVLFERQKSVEASPDEAAQSLELDETGDE